MLSDFDFFKGLPVETLGALDAASEIVTVDGGGTVVRQHDLARHVYFLLSGNLTFELRFEGAGDLYVDSTSHFGEMIGWSAFRAPYRHTATVVAEQTCQFLRIPREAFQAEVRKDAALGYELLCRVAASLAERLDRAAVGVVRRAPTDREPLLNDHVIESPRHDLDSSFQVLQSSAFFDELDPVYVKALANHAERMELLAGQTLMRSGEAADRLYILISGRIDIEYHPDFLTAGQERDKKGVLLITISEPGRILGWSALTAPHKYRATGQTSAPTQVLGIDRVFLQRMADHDPRFGMQLMKRLLWVLGNRLRETRTRLVAQRYDDVVMAISSLLEQNAAQLSIVSPLRKLPVYLRSRLTVQDAFEVLDVMRISGDDVERHLASLLLDLMRDVRRELKIYQQLQNIYHDVAGADPDVSPETVRRSCCEDFQRLFEQTKYIIGGEDLLPAKSGCLFIMNHLTNHRENLLPNDFILTLDTHFVSSMILFRRYGAAPIRVIRKSDPSEYGHQMYYDNLGYIYVTGRSVDPETGGRDQPVDGSGARLFMKAASSRLRAGTNIVICPEGTCTTTEQSSLPFRTGAFRLAAAIDPEPIIVPIAVANFDKKLTTTTLAAVVHEPFLLSEKVGSDPDRATLTDFTRTYDHTFRGYVEHARQLAHDG